MVIVADMPVDSKESEPIIKLSFSKYIKYSFSSHYSYGANNQL